MSFKTWCKCYKTFYIITNGAENRKVCSFWSNFQASRIFVGKARAFQVDNIRVGTYIVQKYQTSE